MHEKEMIPKVIHYCWFGRGPLPELAIKCLESWERYLPDYQIIRWDEDNFDINSNLYVKQAYENRKFAFVSDYVRLYALFNHGGIYMDTDVEVIKNLDVFLHHEFFSGFESKRRIPTGIMGAKKGSQVAKILLDYYTDRSFVRPDGTLDTKTNVAIITEYCLRNGLKCNNTYQIVNGFALYPKTYFCPLEWNRGRSDFSNNTYTIHHFAGSWHSELDTKRRNSFFWKHFGRYIWLIIRVSKVTARLILPNSTYETIRRRLKGFLLS